MANSRQLRGMIVAGVMMWMTQPGPVASAERDLYSGLAYLRAGAQSRAEESLRRYRDEERDPDIRRTVDRVLPLLKRPLGEEVREYIAANLEDRVKGAPRMRTDVARSGYWSRMFPVFP